MRTRGLYHLKAKRHRSCARTGALVSNKFTYDVSVTRVTYPSCPPRLRPAEEERAATPRRISGLGAYTSVSRTLVVLYDAQWHKELAGARFKQL